MLQISERQERVPDPRFWPSTSYICIYIYICICICGLCFLARPSKNIKSPSQVARLLRKLNDFTKYTFPDIMKQCVSYKQSTNASVSERYTQSRPLLPGRQSIIFGKRASQPFKNYSYSYYSYYYIYHRSHTIGMAHHHRKSVATNVRDTFS